MRSLACKAIRPYERICAEAIDICKAADYDLVILESAGVGQSDASILDYVNVSMYVMTPEYGPLQTGKINMLDYADVVCVNKFDKAGTGCLHDVRKQFKHQHGLWTAQDEELAGHRNHCRPIQRCRRE